MNASDARRAHKILDDLIEGNMVLDEEREFLRSALPEYPRQMTLKEIHVMVNDYYTNESDVRGYLPVGGKHVRPWLNELRVQLYGLVRAQEDARESSPSLPEGMRLAEHEELGRVVVSPSKDRDGDYAVFYLHSEDAWGAYLRYVNSSDLTFIDAEPAKPATPPHPEFLETRQDYENAPEGTVISSDNELPYVRNSQNVWGRTGGEGAFAFLLPGTRRRVLRWGWGE